MNPKLQNCINLYMKGIRDGHAREAVTEYTGARYTQHSTGVKDGKEGFIEFFEPFLKRCKDRDIQVIRSIMDETEGKAFLHAYQDINKGDAKWVTTDFFDFDDNDKVIEHWDVIAAFQEEGDKSSIHGPSEIKDLEKTVSNKQIVRNLIEQTWMKQNDVKPTVDTAGCIDHSFQERVASLYYKRIVLLLGQGNFVATLCETVDNKDNQNYAQVDVFRLENDQIVEHWDNFEPVPENDVNGGKF